jgi:hypothetical protein
VIKIIIFAAAVDLSEMSGECAHGDKNCVFAAAVGFLSMQRECATNPPSPHDQIERCTYANKLVLFLLKFSSG